MTETWISQNDALARYELKAPGYIFLDSPRQSERSGGGTGTLFMDNVGVAMINSG